MSKGLKIFLWIFFFPFMIILLIAKSRIFKPLKVIMISVLVLFFMFIALGMSGAFDEVADSTTENEITTEGNGIAIEEDENEISIEDENPEKIDIPALDKEVQILVEKGIIEEHALKIYEVVKESDAPIWTKDSTILKETTAENDYIVTYTAENGMFTSTFAIHMLDQNLKEIVDDNMEVVYSDGQLNANYVFHKNINYDGLKSHAKSVISSILKSPSTAEFPGGWLTPFEGWVINKEGRVIEIASYVDSQNSFGAMIRSDYFIQYRYEDSGSLQPIYVVFDGEAVFDER